MEIHGDNGFESDITLGFFSIESAIYFSLLDGSNSCNALHLGLFADMTASGKEINKPNHVIFIHSFYVIFKF